MSYLQAGALRKHIGGSGPQMKVSVADPASTFSASTVLDANANNPQVHKSNYASQSQRLVLLLQQNKAIFQHFRNEFSSKQ